MNHKTILAGLLSLAMLFGFGLLFVNTNTCTAAIEAPMGTTLPTGTLTGSAGIITKAIKLLAGFVGGLSVLVIIIAGIMYIVSGGDSGKIETAKNMLLYAIIGLVVALIAWVIVNAVITNL